MGDKKSLSRDYVPILQLSLAPISMFCIIFWFNNIFNVYVICVQSKTWVHKENRKFQMFSQNKAVSYKGSCELFCGRTRAFLYLIFPSTRKEATIAIELFLKAPCLPSTPANVFWIVYSTKLFL